MTLNLSGTLNVFRLFLNPSLCLPHATVSTFNDLPVPLSKAFADSEKADIKAVVLDKDNCFAVPNANDIHAPYKARFQQLREEYSGDRLLIVSNTSGTSSDPGGKDAELLEKETGVAVLRHQTKKPGCGSEIQRYFEKRQDTQVTSPSQIAVVGDRLFTDVMLANMMGARAIWVRDGVVGNQNIFARAEKSIARFLTKRGYAPPDPKSTFE
ncbi:HAD-superfamily phosphatase [Myriangium duriaei CBS 260.36]|uniref:HAD-superfamily phosphatase n=1 Tax=Myriangium duriaei CBS 260.36 TaxID=1168546 RepID=A0A9P4J9Q1_9PEZI|nr:HAD-superfamily phosphatase [Myriangium duriaei CBS 260.36]